MIICATKDVFMKTKISEIAEGLETSLLYRTTAEGIKEAISQHNVSQVIIDLNLPNAIEMIKEVKKSFNVKFVGFATDYDLEKKAKEIGVEVMPKSVFFEKLNEILYG